ncbi:MAG TPA: histidine kinase [Xanthomonadales bacterium]|nr:histidine kinase [Xanthomonadales bacterium]
MSAVAVERPVESASDAAAAAAPARERAGPFWPFQVGGWLGYTAYALLNAYSYGKGEEYWKVIAMVASVGFLGTLVLRPVVRSLSHLPPLRFFGSALIPAFVVAAMMGATSLFGWIAVGCDDCRPKTSIGYVGWIGGHIWVVMTWIGLYFGIKNHRRLQEQTQATLSATSAAHQAQLRMLRYQLNPHFLFNTLNAISTLILDRDSPTANRMVTSLSAFLRHSLDADPMQRVTLKQELDAINLYLGIEKIRFADRLTLDFDIEPDAYSALLPSLLLQPLIENAIKYAVAKRVEGGRIGIRARRVGARIEIAVTDDGPGCPAFDSGLPHGNGVGLRNARDRLRVLYGDRASFVVRNGEPRGVEVTMQLPYETSGAIRE